MSDGRLPEPHMRDEFRRELRARLMREAQVTLAPRRRETTWTAWLRPAVAVGLATVVLIAGTGAAAANSVSGDSAFGLKRAIEEVRVALTFGDVERVRVLAELADQRLRELGRVATRDDKAPTASEEYAAAVARFRAAVDALQAAAPERERDEAQDVADAARDKHETLIEQLREQLPEKAKEPIQRAIEEERRDTPKTKEKKDKDAKDRGKDEDDDDSDEGGHRASPRPTERTSAPRTSPPVRRP